MTAPSPYLCYEHSFDVLGAESMGQIGYVLAQALSSVGCQSAPIICQVVVDPQDEAFRDPSKFVGPIYGAKEATALSQSLGWSMKPDGEYFRRYGDYNSVLLYGLRTFLNNHTVLPQITELYLHPLLRKSFKSMPSERCWKNHLTLYPSLAVAVVFQYHVSLLIPKH